MDQHQEQDHDPAAKLPRRTFTAEKKLALLAEYDAADRDGKGELLRRGGDRHLPHLRMA